MTTELEDKYIRLISAITKAEMTMLPSEFAEKFITLSSAVSEVPGKMNYNLTPYAREIVDTLSPYHPAKIVGIMKGAQIGLSQGLLVPAIVWSIAQNPRRIAAFSANDELTKKMMIRVDEAIASAGLQHLLKPNTIKKRNSRSGDTLSNKEFVGGDLMASTLKSIDKISRQNSFAVGLFDDWSSSDISFKKQGDVFEILQQRFSTAANTMKQYYISTPETDPDPTERVYLMGDQRKWMLPCPLCGERIEIKWKQIKWELNEKGRLNESSVKYECQECKGRFSEKHKYEMNLNGIWIPTAEPSRPGIYSYHIPALVAAPFMYDWTYYVYKWLGTFNKGNQSVSKLKPFINQVLGEPWRERVQSVKKDVLSKNTRKYKIGTIPNSLSKEDGNGNIILLTCACDLNGNLDDGRLEYEVKGWSESGSSYSIDAGSIGTYKSGAKLDGRDLWTYRNESNFNNIWHELLRVIDEDYEVDNGGTMRVTLTGVDIGHLSKYAFRFIEANKDRVTGVKGAAHKLMSVTGKDIKLFQQGKESVNSWILQGDRLKDILAENVSLKWDKRYGQPDGFMNFPEPEGGKYTVPDYFAQYEAENKEIETDDDGNELGYNWIRKGDNHFFDCAFYNIAIKNIIVYKIGKELKKPEFTWVDFAELVRGRYE